MVFPWVGDTRHVPSCRSGWSVEHDGQAQPDPIKDREGLPAEALLGLDTGGLLNEMRVAREQALGEWIQLVACRCCW